MRPSGHRSDGRHRTWTSALIGWAAVAVSPAAGQIVTDGSIGPRQTLAGPAFDIPADLGRLEGDNLFHSFEAFNLRAGETARFTTGQNFIFPARVIARVTGSSPSRIDGVVTSELGFADFVFVNRNGIVVGPGGRFNVPGSIVLSTADYLRFADGATWFTDLRAGSSFSSSAPVAFGFLKATTSPAGVEIAGPSPPDNALGDNFFRSRIGVAAGSIRVDNRRLVSIGGTVQLVTAGPGGEARLGGVTPNADETVTVVQPDLSDAPRVGSITISNLAEVGAQDGGSVYLSTGTLDVRSSRVSIDNSNAPGGVIVVRASELNLLRAALTANTDGPQPGGRIDVSAGDILMNGNPASTGGGTSLSGTLAANTTGSGDAGDIVVNARTIRIETGASIVSRSRNADDPDVREGDGGDISVRAARRLIIDGQNFTSTFTGISTESEAPPADNPADGGSLGRPGKIDVSGGRLEIFRTGQIASTAEGRAQGAKVTINVESALLQGETDATPDDVSDDFNTGVEARSQSTRSSLAPGGSVDFSAGTLELVNGGVITASTLGPSAGGGVQVRAGRVRVTGGTNRFTGIFARADPTILGSADAGRSGSVKVEAQRVELFGTGPIRSAGLAARTGISSEAKGTGDADRVGIFTSRGPGVKRTDPTADRARPLSQSPLDGSLIVCDGATVDSRAGGDRQADGSILGSDAGTVELSLAGDLVICDSADVSVSAFVRGFDAGEVIARVAGDVLIERDAARVTAVSGNFGGNITISAGGLILVDGGAILANAEGAAGSAQIALDGGRGVVLRNRSVIDAQAAGLDVRVTIPSTAFFAELGTAILTDNPSFDVQNEVIRELDPAVAALFDASQQLQPLCGSRVVDVSSFVTLGQGGTAPKSGGFVTP